MTTDTKIMLGVLSLGIVAALFGLWIGALANYPIWPESWRRFFEKD